MKTKQLLSGMAVMALVLALGAPAAAQMQDLDRLGELGGVTNLGEIVKMALGGRAPEGVTVEALDGGLVKVAVPLRENSPVVRQKLAKDLVNCAITVEISEPTFAAQLLTFDAAPLEDFEYFAGWVTINTAANDITATSSLKTKGPGPDLNTGNVDIVYDANAFVLLFTDTPGWEAGLHSIDVKVRGAKPGKIKGNFCVGCA